MCIEQDHPEVKGTRLQGVDAFARTAVNCILPYHDGSIQGAARAILVEPHSFIYIFTL